MSSLPACPKCASEYSYSDGHNMVCPDCAHEWPASARGPDSGAGAGEAGANDDEGAKVVKDANGNPLQNGDSVVVLKDLKVKGSSTVVKVGTKVRNIRLVDGDHDIDCRIDGVGAIGLKSEFVRKA